MAPCSEVCLSRSFDTQTSWAPTARLAAAGFIATAVAFGPARMGFGLFLPAFREDFALSTSLAGAVASGGFAAFLAALPFAAWLDHKISARTPIVIGALFAAAGFTLVASAQGPIALAAGVALAGASAGFCWSPFNDAAERIVPARARPTALSAVSTGTTLGVAAAGGLALAVTLGALPWRWAWSLFAGVAVIAALAGAYGVRTGRERSVVASGDDRPAFFRADTAPLYIAAILFGATNAAYLSFAADRVVSGGGLDVLPGEGAAAVIFISYGAFGLAGLATGWAEARLGLPRLLALVFAAFAASMALVALAPASWAGVVISAGLHGAGVMTISAILSFWSLSLFPGRGAAGFTAALIGAAAGSVAGPMALGALIDLTGAQAAFVIAALPAGLAACLIAGPAGRLIRS